MEWPFCRGVGVYGTIRKNPRYPTGEGGPRGQGLLAMRGSLGRQPLAKVTPEWGTRPKAPLGAEGGTAPLAKVQAISNVRYARRWLRCSLGRHKRELASSTTPLAKVGVERSHGSLNRQARHTVGGERPADTGLWHRWGIIVARGIFRAAQDAPGGSPGRTGRRQLGGMRPGRRESPARPQRAQWGDQISG